MANEEKKEKLGVVEATVVGDVLDLDEEDFQPLLT